MKKEALQKRINTLLSEKLSDEKIFELLLKEGYLVKDIQNVLDNKTGLSETDRQKRTVEIIISIGAILIGVGLFSFIASNWQEMTRLAKVVIIIISMLASYSFGWYLDEHTKLQKSAYGLYLLGSIIYGAGIFLIGQMFHLPAEWSEGFILWSLGLIFFLIIKPFYLLSLLTLATGMIGAISFVGDEPLFGVNRSILMLEVLVLLACIITFIYGFALHQDWRKKINDKF